MKKRFFILVIVMLILISVACKNDINKYDAKTYVIGDTVENNGVRITVNSTRWAYEDEKLQNEEGYKWLVIDITISNKSNKSYYIWPTHFEMNNMFGEILSKEWLSQGIEPDKKVRGEVAFKVSKIMKDQEFIFNYNENEQVVFILSNI
ncbi:UNVERIFIED_CONTAM: uncharacterized protein DUF4352 [Acetivibrio alkalicellulosi]